MSSYYKRYVQRHTGDQLDRKLRARITNAVINKSLAIVVLPLLMTLLMVIVVVIGEPLFHYAEDALGVSTALIHAFIATPMLIGIFLTLLGLLKQKKVARKTLHRELLASGIRPEICLYCDYSLNRSVSDTCPECGAGLAPLDANRRGKSSQI